MKTTEEIIALANDMLTSYVCTELKNAAEAYIANPEDANAKALSDILPSCIATIDEAIAFAKSDYCKEKFGDMAETILAETQKAKDNGAEYCGCDGCTKALALLEALK